jgi:hypothetical protein
MRLENCFSRYISPTLVLAGALSLGGVGVAQTRAGSVPDAQIEANVLKSLASAPELTNQTISTTTAAGVVTLSGSVQSEALRQKAEQLASTAPGVQKVVDELTLGDSGAGQNQMAQNQAPQGVLQSDGTYAPAAPAAGMQADPQQQGGATGQDVPPPNGPNTDAYGRPLTGAGAATQQGQGDGSQYPQQVQPGQYPQAGQYPQQGQPPQQSGQYPPQNGQYPQQQYPQGQYPQSQYPQQGGAEGPYGPPQRPPSHGGQQQPGHNQGFQPGTPGYGQVGGQAVTVPPGTVLQVRVNQHLNSKDVKVGTTFDAMVVRDVIANGRIAIPRGAFVQGTVVDAESSKALSGRGELGLQLNQISLGGKTYPIVSDTFTAHGGDKTIQSVNSAVGLGALGAIFGAVAGGGAGAAIGAGVGGAVGLGSSAASGRGNVFIPSEAVLNFRLTQPAQVTTVSQAEMQRLGYGVPAGPQMVRRYPPPGYYGPAYYPYPRYYYRPYGYYPY